MKSDIWSMACIIAELYTGEMYFPTHENVEHLALMQKVCGYFPSHMIETSQSQFKECFEFSSTVVKMKWPKVAKKKDSIRSYDEMKTLRVIYPFNNSIGCLLPPRVVSRPPRAKKPP